MSFTQGESFIVTFLPKLNTIDYFMKTKCYKLCNIRLVLRLPIAIKVNPAAQWNIRIKEVQIATAFRKCISVYSLAEMAS